MMDLLRFLIVLEVGLIAVKVFSVLVPVRG